MYLTPLHTESVSKENKYAVIKYFLAACQSTRAEAAKALSISTMTVGKVVFAMLERGLLSAEKTTGACGRATELLRVTHSLYTLLVTLKKEVLRASLVKTNSTEEPLISSHINPSLSYEDNVRAFLSLVKLNLQKSCRPSTVAIVYEGKKPSDELINFAASLEMMPDILVSYEDAIGLYFESNYPKSVALHIDIGANIKLSLYANGECLSHGALGHGYEYYGEEESASQTSKALRSLFETVVPSHIAVESDKVTVDKRFLTLIEKKLTEKLSSEISTNFVFEKDMSFAGAAILQMTVELLAARFSGKE